MRHWGNWSFLVLHQRQHNTCISSIRHDYYPKICRKYYIITIEQRLLSISRRKMIKYRLYYCENKKYILCYMSAWLLHYKIPHNTSEQLHRINRVKYCIKWWNAWARAWRLYRNMQSPSVCVWRLYTVICECTLDSVTLYVFVEVFSYILRFICRMCEMTFTSRYV